MRILYLHQYFRKPSEGGALRSYYLSTALAKAGHEVELVTAYNGKTYKTEIIAGVKVHYLPVAYDNRYGFPARIKAFLKFSWQSTRLAFKLKNVDVCFATSTPLTIGIPALLLKKFRGTPYFFEVRDLWPEAPVQLGFIRNELLKTVLFWFEKLLYRNATKIVALSPGMVAGVKKYKLPVPVFLIPNIADCRFYQPVFTEKVSASTPFVISYLGTLGRANRVDFLLDIAKLCQEMNLHQVKFLIAGSGAESRHLKQKAQKLNLHNVTFTGHFNRHQVQELLNRSAATYTSFAKFPVLETNSPNKFFDSLAAGKLCLVNTKGWLQDLVEKNNCGFYADPNQPTAFVQKLLPYLTDPTLLKTCQRNARELAEREFSREKLSRKFVAMFENNSIKVNQ
ncbi:glycosyltransferase family 4 protein [Adhaeribacter sp. BT258]|uniref:Glycosyltransferase family 4 protein n=1 Tax=Adhaeribacter terrigena TaxID=2793070 RepID=A0ABS1C4Y2_9BACT|nr:glycosyltransferase family 4 protein [Adhaeribacter terrigena]MBK0404455.1 glycosyltransferase family 4 protein [Adhaeribacter terrigena]